MHVLSFRPYGYFAVISLPQSMGLHNSCCFLFMMTMGTTQCNPMELYSNTNVLCHLYYSINRLSLLLVKARPKLCWIANVSPTFSTA